MAPGKKSSRDGGPEEEEEQGGGCPGRQEGWGRWGDGPAEVVQGRRTRLGGMGEESQGTTAHREEAPGQEMGRGSPGQAETWPSHRDVAR